MKKKIVFIAPHLSTGGMPQYLVKQIESIKDEMDVYCVEWGDVTGGVLVVQRNKMVKLLGDRLITLGENKHQLFDIINKIKPDIIHLQEIPELFMERDVADKLYITNRNYVIIETSHDSGYHPDSNKIYLPDKFLMVSQYQANLYKNIDVPCDVVEYPIENKTRTKTREQALRDLGLDPNLKHVINVGLFTPRKNQSEVIEYARMLQNYPIQFHFIGNQADNFRYYWEPLMKEFPSNCKWWNERSDVDSFYEAADLFLFTSRGSTTDHETMPLVIREALSWKTPSMFYNLPVYMGYFDKYDTIEYLKDDVQTNAYRIAEKLLLEQSNNHMTNSVELTMNTSLNNPPINLSTYRMHFLEECGGVNTLHGLYDMIKEHFKPDFVMAEIGSFGGVSTELFAKMTKKVYSIDPYLKYPEVPYDLILQAETMFLEMQKRQPNIVKIKKTSLEGVKEIEDNSLDAVYIDGAHDYINVKKDILAWLPKVKNGGIICGHDYSGPVVGWGTTEINQAVQEVFPDEKIYTYKDSSWAVIKKENVKSSLREIYIVSTYPNTEEKEKLLNDTVIKFKKLGKDVLITSHYPVPEYIVEKADYYIYDSKNTLDTNRTLETNGADYWLNDAQFRLESIIVNHVSSLSRTFSISMDFVKNLGYEYFVIIESDSEYDLDDLKYFDTIRDKTLQQKRRLFFCKPRAAEFMWNSSHVYETYCFGGVLTDFYEIYKFPKELDDWKNDIKDLGSVCIEYVLYKKFHQYESDYLILGTIKSWLRNSKVDLFSHSGPSGVYYNLKDEHLPILFLYNNDEDDVEFKFNNGVWYKTIKLNKQSWYYEVLDIQNNDNLNIRIEKYVKRKLQSSTQEIINRVNIKERKKYRTIRFKN